MATIKRKSRNKYHSWALVILVATAVLVPIASAHAVSVDCEEKAFLALINSYRQQNGLAPVARSPILTTATQAHSAEMANLGYFSHNAVDGRSPIQRIQALGYSGYTGECISAGYNYAADALNSWKSSPSHNSLMLDPNHRAIGIGRAYKAGSRYGWYWTIDFGSYDDSNGVAFAESCRYCTSWISGRVVSRAWQLIPNAAIRLDSIPITFDGRDGHFIAGEMPMGVHTVYYDAPGYQSQTQVVEMRHNWTTQAPTCLLSLSSGNPGGTSGVGEIFGRVANQTGRIIPGTCIRINATLMPTNAAGDFRFTLVYPGNHTVYYDAPGYRGQTQVLEVRASQVTRPPTVIMSR